MTTVVVRVVVLLIALVVVAGMLVVRWVVRRRALARSPLPPLFFPLSAQSGPKASHGNGTANGTLHSSGQAHANGASSANGAARPFATPHASKAAFDAATPIPRPVGDRPRTQRQHSLASLSDDYRDGETVRFYRPSEQALQLLPGHLEVLEGATREREIRFVRVPGEPPHVILGRDAGPSPSAVGLGSTTVSRRHARLDFVDGRWHVMNLSRTNPLVVNDDQLADTDAARLLADGDRLELGEVVLRFHEH